MYLASNGSLTTNSDKNFFQLTFIFQLTYFMLTYTNPTDAVTLTIPFGCYEEVYELQRSLLFVLRAATQNTDEQFVHADTTPVLDLLQATLLTPDQLADFTPNALPKSTPR